MKALPRLLIPDVFVAAVIVVVAIVIIVALVILLMVAWAKVFPPRRAARRTRRVQPDTNWGDSTPCFAIDSDDGGSPDSSGSDFSGDGGTFDGGGASGNWDD